MKKTLNTLTLAVGLLAGAAFSPLAGQAQDSRAAKKLKRDSLVQHFGTPGHFVLQGQVQHFDKDFFEFGMTTYLDNVVKAVPLQDDGTFHAQFEVSNTQDIYLYLPGSRTIILSVCENDTLTLNWDGQAPRESFSIHSADPVRDLQLQVQWDIHRQHRKAMIDLREELYENRDVYTPSEKYKRVNDRYNAVLETVLAHADGGKADLDRILLAHYYNLTNLLIDNNLYPVFRLRALRDSVPDYAVFSLDNPFPWYSEDHFVHVPDFRDFYLAITRKANPYMGTRKVDGGTMQTNMPMMWYHQVRASQGSDIMQDCLMAQELTRYLRQTSFDYVEEAYERFMAEGKTPLFKSATEELYASMQKIYPGQMAPDFTLKDEHGNDVSLSDFRGKVVYIDFWGVYCGPCIYDIENFLPQVHQYYEDKDVVFINICVDTNEEKWKSGLEKYNVHGINLIAEGWTRHPVCQDYNVKGIPNYMLINRDGTIANNNPQRPGMLARTLGENEIDKAL